MVRLATLIDRVICSTKLSGWLSWLLVLLNSMAALDAKRSRKRILVWSGGLAVNLIKLDQADRINTKVNRTTLG